MSEENKVSNEAVAESGAESNVQEAAQPELAAEIANSKKYRKRAQEAESELLAVKKQIAKNEELTLKEKEDFKTLYEKVSSENEGLSTQAEKWNAYEDKKRTSLLEKHPDEERDSLSKLDLETLEYITSKISKTTNPEVVGRAKVSTPPTNKPWAEMSDSERREFYTFKAQRKG